MTPAAPAIWTPEDEARYRALRARVEDVEPLGNYIARVNPRYPPPRHLNPLIEALEESRRRPVFVVVSMPPRHRKTTTVANGLAWRMALDPGQLHAYVTYNQKQARKKSRLVRQIASRSGVLLDPSLQSLDDWRILAPDGELGGGLMATGIGGSLTGEGIDGILVIDDSLKNRKEAESAQRREDQWEWFTDVALTRLEPGSSLFIVMTRWNEEDLAGRVTAGKFAEAAAEAGVELPDWQEIRLPAICEDEADGTGRRKGEALWPEQYPLTYLRPRQILNPWSFSALYQQRPTAKHGKLFKRDPDRFHLEEFLRRGIDGKRLVIAVDPAASDSTKADHWAAVVMAAEGWGDLMKAWLLGLWHEQTDPLTGAERIYDLQRRWGCEIILEGGVVGKAPAAALRRQNRKLRIEEIPPEGDKYLRAQPAAAAWNGGRLLVPIGVPWADKLITQHREFTGVDGREDDIVDGVAIGWNALADVDPIEDAAPRRLPVGGGSVRGL